MHQDQGIFILVSPTAALAAATISTPSALAAALTTAPIDASALTSVAATETALEEMDASLLAALGLECIPSVRL